MALRQRPGSGDGALEQRAPQAAADRSLDQPEVAQLHLGTGRVDLRLQVRVAERLTVAVGHQVLGAGHRQLLLPARSVPAQAVDPPPRPADQAVEEARVLRRDPERPVDPDVRRQRSGRCGGPRGLLQRPGGDLHRRAQAAYGPTSAPASRPTSAPGRSSLERRSPLPRTTQSRATTRSSTSTGQVAGTPTGVMPPYSMPVSPTARSCGAKEALRTSSRLRTARLTSTRLSARATQAASRSSSPRRPSTTTQLAEAASGRS